MRELMRTRPIRDKRLLSDIAWEKALSGDLEWAKFVINNAEGMPHQSVETNLSDTDKAYLEHLKRIEEAMSAGGN